MANEFNIKNGFITSGNSNVYANLNVSGGITATTISATTYINIPSFSGGTLTGLTINGDLNVTGNTNITGVTTFNSAPVFNNLTSASEINALVIDGAGNVYFNSEFINTINSSTGIDTTTVGGVTTITNTLPDQTVSITGGTNMEIVGTYPNFGVNFTGTTDYLSLSGGTVTGSTIFTNGLTANTISATTYYNLPTDIRTTGATYSNNNFTFTNNTGGTYSTSFNTVTGLTVNGNLTVTGNTSLNTLTAITVSSSTINLVSPITSTTESTVLVRNSSTGNVEVRSINNLINENNSITVALTGSTGVDFNSIKDAVNSITGATSANTYTVRVAGGVYNEDPFTIPSWVAVVGESSLSTVIQANDASQTLINLSDQSALFDCQVQGCTGTSVSAIVYSSSTTPQSSAISYVENVRFGSNYTHAKVVAYGGANIIMQCSNVKYGGYPFTIGFYATNSGSGIGRMQLRNVTSTNGGIATTTGLIFAKADAASCGFIVNGCLLTKAAGAAAGTGFYVENGGFLRLTAVNFQRWAVGIDAPQVGTAPSIDAIALNFENNTIDVNIAHSGATGKIQGTDNFLKTIINPNAPLYEVNQDPKEITVAKKGGDFTSIKSAVDYLISSGNTSSTNRYVISVGPGEFTEPEIDLTSTPYVSIVGSNIQTTLIKPSGATQHIISIGINNEVSFLSLSGAPSGYAGIYCYDIGDFAQAHKISFTDCDTNVWVESNTQDTNFFGEYLDFNGEYTYGTKVIGNNGFIALANMENYYNFPTGAGIVYCNYATGSGATLSIFVGDNQSNGVSGSTAFYVQDAAGLYASTITCDGFTYGIRNPNIGDPIRFDVDNASFVDGEWDLYVERATTFGTFGGSSSHEKLFSNSSDVYWALLDIDDGEFDITRKASVTFADGTHTDFTTLIFEGGAMGLISGGTLSIVSGTTVEADGGFGYLEKSSDNGVVKRIDWLNTQITIPTNSNEYVFLNENGILSSSGTRPDSFYNIILGRVVTNSTSVAFIDLSPFNAEHTSNRFGALFSEALGPIYAQGSLVTEGSTPFTINVSAGEYYYSTNEYMPSGGTGLTFTQYYRNGTGATWVTSATTLVNNTQFDNNGTLTGLTTSYFTKHTLYLLGDGSYEKYFLVLGQNQYSTLVEAEGALLPTPPTYFSDSVTQIANIYIQQGDANIIQIEDIRPTISFRAGGVNASSVHGNLLGLASDDHLQYLLVDGARAMSGNLNMGSNNITSVGTVDGVTVSAHASRHKFGGADEVGTTTPTANAIPFADVNGKLDSWITPITISGGTGISTGGTYPNLSISFTGGTIPSATRFTNGLSANTISATTATIRRITGGSGNTNSGTYSFIGGGVSNSVTQSHSLVSGGLGNTVSGQCSAVVGGQNNIVSGNTSTISGGYYNINGGAESFIGAGRCNTIGGNSGGVIGGGTTNTVSANYSFIGGGTLNTSSGYISTVGGGSNNTASSQYTTVGGGYKNTSSGYYSFIGGGHINCADGVNSTVSGGYNNTALAKYSAIGGGTNNAVNGTYATAIFGGAKNTVSGNYSFIGGGLGNTVSGLYSGVLGGCQNTVTGNYSFAAGCGLNATNDLTLYTNNILTETLTATTISATTYYNLPVSGLTQGTNVTITNNGSGNYTINATGGGGGVTGSGTSNFIPRWTGTTALGNSLIQDNGTNIGVNTTPSSSYKMGIYSLTNTPLYVQNQTSNGTSISVYSNGSGSQTGISSIGYGGASFNNTGVIGQAYDGLLAIGIKGNVGITEFGSITTGIGGYFDGIGDGGFGVPTNSYSVQLIDGTEGTNKVLISKTSDGKANWSDVLTGLTNVRSTTISATTYQGNVVTQIVAGTNVTISPTGGTGTVTINAAGGSGSPGGTTGEVQFNNAGSFSGAANVEISSGNLQLVSTTDPAAPSAGNLIVYSKDIAGRQMPKWIGPSGIDTPFQSNIMFNNVSVIGPGGGTTVGVLGCTVTSVGTISNPNITTTNLKTQTRRITNTSANTAGSLASTRIASLECWRGNVAGQGGFFVVARFGLTTLQTGMRMFIGLTDNATAAPTNIDPTTSTTPGKIGMAINASTGNWNLVHNITGTAPTIIALGASYPVDITSLYELILFAKPNDTVITYRITNLSTNAQTSGTLSTNLPSTTTPLGRVCWATNNATAAAVAWDLSRFSLESDY